MVILALLWLAIKSPKRLCILSAARLAAHISLGDVFQQLIG